MPNHSEKASSAAASPKWRSTRSTKCRSGRGGWLRCSYMGSAEPLLEPSEAVHAPLLAPHPVMHDVESLGVVLLLDRLQARVIGAEVVLSPALVEEVALREVGAGLRGDLPELRGRRVDLACVAARRIHVHRRT